MKEIWVKTGTGNNQRYIPIHNISNSLGIEICKMLPAFHAITGCDSVASFFSIGKKKAFGIFREIIDDISNLTYFGDTPVLPLSHDSVVAAIQLVCRLYENSSTNVDINLMRYKLFTQKGISGPRLPPTLDALTLHLQRANYQSFIWKSSCCPILALPSPIGNGWKRTGNDSIEQERMTADAVPDAVAEFTRCKCKKGCKSNSCSCRRNKLLCSEACLCTNSEDCENNEYIDNDDDDDVNE